MGINLIVLVMLSFAMRIVGNETTVEDLERSNHNKQIRKTILKKSGKKKHPRHS
jgi:Na+-transporting methylmalonyl-CoA/oxaloacetate decarboxylase gamma subunit